MADGRVPRMIFLGFGKWARSDRIYALEPLPAGERGHGRRTRVWVEGVPEPIVASRTERTILADMGEDSSEGTTVILDDALDLAERLDAHVELPGCDHAQHVLGPRQQLGALMQTQDTQRAIQAGVDV